MNIVLSLHRISEIRSPVFLLGRYGDVRDANEMRMGKGRE